MLALQLLLPDELLPLQQQLQLQPTTTTKVTATPMNPPTQKACHSVSSWCMLFAAVTPPVLQCTVQRRHDMHLYVQENTMHNLSIYDNTYSQ